jgi:hypothetical protein
MGIKEERTLSSPAVPITEIYVMIVTRRSGITRFSELIGAKARQTSLGAIPNSTLEHAPILLRDALNANLKVVSGHKGSADIRLAVDSGEVGGFSIRGARSRRAHWRNSPTVSKRSHAGMSTGLAGLLVADLLY